MKWPFYASCALNGILAGVLCFACGGAKTAPACDSADRFLGPTRDSSPFRMPAGHEPARTQSQRFQPAERAHGGSADRLGGLVTALSLLWRAELSNGRQMVGDGGYAHGHFQQHRAHWKVGCGRLGVSWPYPCDSGDLVKAAAIAAAKYAPDALKGGDVEMLIRKHRKPNRPLGKGQDEYLARVTKGAKNE